jgi:hypothetical protein
MRPLFAEHRRWHRRLIPALAALAGLAIGLSACGSSSSKAADPPQASSSAVTQSSPSSTAAASSASSSSASSEPASGSPSADDCNGAVARVTAAVAAFSEVTKVTMVAACGQASIETNLPAGVLGSASADTGIKICKAAATTAYQGDLSSITVDSVDGHELAIGLKGADCLP